MDGFQPRPGNDSPGTAALHRRAAFKTAEGSNNVNMLILVANAIGFVVLAAVTSNLVFLFVGALVTALTWLTLQWFRHTLLLLADISLSAEAAITE